MPGNITFTSGSSNLMMDFQDVLDSVVLVVEEYKQTTIFVSGHTDSVGSNTLNQRLSDKRANSVANYLKNKGVLEARFDVAGFGEDHPVADNGTAEGRSLNRRVELSLLPITE